MSPSATVTVHDARQAFFARSGFDEASYTAPWVDIPVGPMTLRFPNAPARQRVVPVHDLHHTLTGYGTDLAGEAEVAAWEIASGIGRHWVGWYLDLLTFSYGAVVHPRRTYRAFLRGRGCTNFFRVPLPAMDAPVEQVREAVGLDRGRRPNTADRLAFAGWTATAVVTGLGSLVTTLPVMAALGTVARLSSPRVPAARA